MHALMTDQKQYGYVICVVVVSWIDLFNQPINGQIYFSFIIMPNDVYKQTKVVITLDYSLSKL